MIGYCDLNDAECTVCVVAQATLYFKPENFPPLKLENHDQLVNAVNNKRKHLELMPSSFSSAALLELPDLRCDADRVRLLEVKASYEHFLNVKRDLTLNW